MMDIPAVHVYENDIFESYWYNMIQQDGVVHLSRLHSSHLEFPFFRWREILWFQMRVSPFHFDINDSC